MINADDYLLIDFGILQEGEFDANGGINGWKIEGGTISKYLPIFCRNEPVIHLDPAPGYEVYLHGLYSERLSKKGEKLFIVTCQAKWIRIVI